MATHRLGLVVEDKPTELSCRQRYNYKLLLHTGISYVTGFGKTRHMGFFVKIKFDVYLISSTLELTYLHV